MTICDVFDTSDGSEMSDLLTTLLRCGGMDPGFGSLVMLVCYFLTGVVKDEKRRGSILA